MSFYRNFPGRNIHSMKKQFERMYDEFMHGEEGHEELFDLYPAANVEDTEKFYVFTIELPGVKKEDVNIVFQDNRLVISGDKIAMKENSGNFTVNSPSDPVLRKIK